MRPKPQDQTGYFIGVLFSLVAHCVFAVVAVFIMETSAADAARPVEIFTVTLEGGENVGGAFQLPKEGKEQSKPKQGETPSTETEVAPPPKEEAPEEPKKEAKAEPVEEKEEKPLEQPSVVEDPEKIALAKKLEEQKLNEEKKKKAEEEKKKTEEEKKKKAEQAKLDEQKQKERDKKLRDARLASVARRIKNNYQGESVNAGGEGFGAARSGGLGMGGGTLASAEKIAYADALQKHVKQGWRWMAGSKRLRALVVVRIQPTGAVQDVRIDQSSGSGSFDDSVIRAVRKADPVPAPPAKFYQDFSSVRFWFDSHDR